MTATFTPAASPVVIEVPVYMLHNDLVEVTVVDLASGHVKVAQ